MDAESQLLRTSALFTINFSFLLQVQLAVPPAVCKHGPSPFSITCRRSKLASCTFLAALTILISFTTDCLIQVRCTQLSCRHLTIGSCCSEPVEWSQRQRQGEPVVALHSACHCAQGQCDCHRLQMRRAVCCVPAWLCNSAGAQAADAV